jgi:hypothetical protein
MQFYAIKYIYAGCAFVELGTHTPFECLLAGEAFNWQGF